MLSLWHYPDRKPWFGEEWLGKWLPLPKSNGCIVVSDVDSGQEKIRFEDREQRLQFFSLSDDGRVLVTFFTVEDRGTIACWDVPGRPSLGWSIGVPAGFGGCAVLVWCWIRKRNAPRVAAPVS